MADTVTTQVIWSSDKYALIQLTNVSDGTGEATVKKVDLDGTTGGVSLAGPRGEQILRVGILDLKWNIQGMDYVKLAWDHSSTDDVIHLMTGADKVSYSDIGGFVDPNSDGDTLGAATVGDIVLTTSGQVSGATYTIDMLLQLYVD